MITRIVRHHQRRLDLAITTDPATTEPIDFREAAGGVVFLPAEAGINTLAFYAAPARGVDPLPLVDAAGNVVELEVAAGHAYALPDACFGIGLLFLVADGDAVVSISLKG